MRSHLDSHDQMWLEKKIKWKTIDNVSWLSRHAFCFTVKNEVEEYGILYMVYIIYEQNMVILFSWHFCFSYRRTQHPVSDACSLSLAIAGITSEAARSRVVNILRCLIFMKQLNNRNDTTQWRIFWDKKYHLRQTANRAKPPDCSRVQIGLKILCVASFMHLSF